MNMRTLRLKVLSKLIEIKLNFQIKRNSEEKNIFSMKNFNISLIGDSAVGKTTIANILCNNSEFNEEYIPTVGASMLKVPYQDGENLIWFYIWDTAGMEAYRSLAPVYYRNSSAALIVYDISKRETFNNIEDWYNLYSNTVGPDLPVIFIGNKIDLEEERSVSYDEAERRSKEMNGLFLETSAKTKKNIYKILEILAEVLKNYESHQNSSAQLVTEKTTECC